jgi:hypothetical protein
MKSRLLSSIVFGLILLVGASPSNSLVSQVVKTKPNPTTFRELLTDNKDKHIVLFPPGSTAWYSADIIDVGNDYCTIHVRDEIPGNGTLKGTTYYVTFGKIRFALRRPPTQVLEVYLE